MRLGVIAATIALLSGLLFLQPTSARADTSVSVGDNSFSPQTITIAPGDTVTWTNNGSMSHTVTADDSSYSSGTLSPGNTFSHTYGTAGTFPYYCQFHGAPGGVGMSGKVIVDASLTSSSTNSSNSTSTNNTSSSTSTTSTTNGTDTNNTNSTSTSATSTSGTPVLSNGSVVPNDTGATISWTTDLNSDAQVSYGITTAYTTTTSSDGQSATSHSVTIAGLVPGTTYHFKAMSTASGVMGMSPDETFTTTNNGSSGTSTATTTPTGTGTSTPPTGTTTPPIDTSTLSGQIAQLEADIKALEMQIQALLGGVNIPGGNPPPNGGPMTSTLGSAVYADNYSVSPGGSLQFHGTGFGANETVDIIVNGTVVGTVRTDANGAFSISGTAANSSGDMTYWFSGMTSGKSDSVMITTGTNTQ